MSRAYTIATALALGLAALAFHRLTSELPEATPRPEEQPAQRQSTQRSAKAEPQTVARGELVSDRILRRLERLEAQLEKERAMRLALAAEIDQLRERGIATAPESDSAAAEDPKEAASAAPSGRHDGRPRHEIDYSKSQMERALVSAGIDESTAADIKRHGDEIAMTEMYLRDQATREGWLGTPRFKEEMAALAEERTDLRDEIGDDAYDRYLFAMGQRNRVIVNDVLQESVAADAGLQTGDMIIRYDGARVFLPEELVSHTHTGELGETVWLRVIRNRKVLEIEVPRGPLGLRIGATQDNPDIS